MGKIMKCVLKNDNRVHMEERPSYDPATGNMAVNDPL